MAVAHACLVASVLGQHHVCPSIGLVVHAYVFMMNHMHLLALPATEDSMLKTPKSLGRHYMQYFNYRNQRTGTLGEGRCRAAIKGAWRHCRRGGPSGEMRIKSSLPHIRFSVITDILPVQKIIRSLIQKYY